MQRLINQAKLVAPRLTARLTRILRPRLVSVAIVEGGATSRLPLPASTLVDRQAVSNLRSGDRVWLAEPVLLSFMTSKVDLHLLRQPDSQPWSLVRELEASGGRVLRLRQYDQTSPPRWAAAGTRPPPARRSPGAVLPRRSVKLAPQGSVQLARPIGVFVHAYYVDLLPLIVERLALVEHPFALYVSTTSEDKAEAIRAMVPEATVRVFPNQGRVIAPKVFGFAREHEAHDVVLHLHTKRSPHRSGLSDWFPYLLDCLLPSPEGINAIVARFAESETLGMVSPAVYPGLGTSTRWGPNRAIAEVITWGSDWPPLPDDDRLAFAAGSMFWARSAALVPLRELGITTEAFSDSTAADGTLAHAVERLIGVSCTVAGLEQIFVSR